MRAVALCAAVAGVTAVVPVSVAQGSGSPAVSSFGLGTERPYDIAAGPDGAMWFTNSSPSSPGSGHDSIGRITTSGAITGYTGTGVDGPEGIAAGPDGAMWFTNQGNNSIGRITTSGLITNYTGTGINRPRQPIGGGP